LIVQNVSARFVKIDEMSLNAADRSEVYDHILRTRTTGVKRQIAIFTD